MACFVAGGVCKSGGLTGVEGQYFSSGWVCQRGVVRAPACRRVAGKSCVRMVIAPQIENKITVTGNNINLTDSLREYVVEKIGKVLNKYQQLVTRADVHLQVARNASIKHTDSAEVVVQVKGNVLRSEVKSEGMYGSIDLVADKLARTLRKYKERHTVRNGPKISSFIEGVEVESDPEESDDSLPFEDENGVPRVTSVLKRKSFPITPQTVEEAALCLEYIDHSFYVFLNKETDKIAVVYKRNHGGIGLIEPTLA